MKKITQLVAGIAIMLISQNGFGQAKTGAVYFEGKWSLLVKGLPDGDTKMFLVLEKKDTVITGIVQDSTGIEISKIDRSEFTDSTATVYFTARGYDVNLFMAKKDEDHIAGSLMGMFEAEGDRVKVIR